VILFQHNNLRSIEWTSIRRELYRALQKVDETLIAQSQSQGTDPAGLNLIGSMIKLQVVQTTMLEPALRIVEYYNPQSDLEASPDVGLENIKDDPSLTHALSRSAYKAAKQHQNEHTLTPILKGNIALLTFPTVSPVHLKAALSILSPSPPSFPAPTRRANPNYHEPAVQDGLKKLLLLAARVEGEIFDMEGTRWVGSIDGGIDGLRAQVVQILQMAGVGLTQTLEAAGKNLWMTMESRRQDLEVEGEGTEKQNEQ
jgi:ribosomal protein L10